MSLQNVSNKDLRVLVEREPVPEAWERLLRLKQHKLPAPACDEDKLAAETL